MGYILTGFSSSYFDDSEAAASVGAGATVVVKSYTGKGLANIVVVGDGNLNVDLAYSIDGGANVVIGASNAEALVVVAFQVSLDVKAINNDGIGAHNRSSVSQTGSMN